MYTQTIQRTTQNKQHIEQHKNTKRNNTKIRKSAGRAPSLRVLSWHLPYNRGKSTDKPQRAITNPNPFTKILDSTSHSHNVTSAPLPDCLLVICYYKGRNMCKCSIYGFSYEHLFWLWMEFLTENNVFFIFRTSLVVPCRGVCRPNDR
jgi:hypothetical protein